MRYWLSVRRVELMTGRVLELYRSGMTSEAVGRILGCSRSTIDRRLRAIGALREEKRVAALNPRWKGGRYLTSSGYVMIRVGPRRYRQEHRVVMERMLGRPLRRGEVVHHRNGVKSENGEANLELVSSNGEHTRAHHRRYPRPTSAELLRMVRVMSRRQIAQCLGRALTTVRAWLRDAVHDAALTRSMS